jgi:UDP-N-acetylmuramyl pentapeptide synthase
MNFLKKFVIWVLTIESRLIIRKYKPFIIAVTGSVGKTATKDAIFCALINTGHIRKSEKSLNSEFGLPLTIIGVPTAWRSFSGWIHNMLTGLSLIIKKQNYPEVLILEIGADHPGDIKKVVKWLHPDIAVITRVGDKPVHVEFFSSPEQVFEEKSALARAVRPGGSVVLFADEPKIVALGQEIAQKSVSVKTFGLSEEASVRGSIYMPIYDEVDCMKVLSGFSFNLSSSQHNAEIIIKNTIGRTFMYPLLCAMAVGQVRGVSEQIIVENIARYEAPKGRMNLIAGKNNSTIIDDTYNSSPDAVDAALQTLSEIQCSGKKIVTLGDMMELGTYSVEEHKKVGKKVIGVADILVTVGPRARAIGDEALEHGMSKDKMVHYSSSTEAGEYLNSMVGIGDIVLVKGSQSVRMERVVKALMADPSQASDLLVRQEQEWLDKK